MEFEQFRNMLLESEADMTERENYELHEVSKKELVRDCYNLLNRDDLTEAEVRNYSYLFHASHQGGTLLKEKGLRKLMTHLGEVTKALAFIGIGTSSVGFFCLWETPEKIYEVKKDLDGNGIEDVMLEKRNGNKEPFYGIRQEDKIIYINTDEMRKSHISPESSIRFYEEIEKELNK